MFAPNVRTTPRINGPWIDSEEIAATCAVLRELAASDRSIDPGRGQVSAALAALVATTAQNYENLPAQIADRLAAVVQAVDVATGHRR